MGALNKHLHWIAAAVAGVNIGLAVAIGGWLGLFNAIAGLTILAVVVALLHSEHFTAWVSFVNKNHVTDLRFYQDVIDELHEERRQMSRALEEAGIVNIENREGR